ncbi:MAG: hypothetical protein ACPF91_09210 [Flavobacteriales bacterium]
MKNDMNALNHPFSSALFAFVVGLLFSPVMIAQDDVGQSGISREALRERMEVMAVGFLTEELELDAETAQAFWPMYNAHKEELLGAGENLKEIQNAMNALQGNADAEFYDLLNRLEAEEAEIPRLRAQFLRELANEFGVNFAIRYSTAQKKFKQQFRNLVQERMSQKDRRALGKMGRARF